MSGDSDNKDIQAVTNNIECNHLGTKVDVVKVEREKEMLFSDSPVLIEGKRKDGSSMNTTATDAIADKATNTALPNFQLPDSPSLVFKKDYQISAKPDKLRFGETIGKNGLGGDEHAKRSENDSNCSNDEMSRMMSDDQYLLDSIHSMLDKDKGNVDLVGKQVRYFEANDIECNK